MTFFYGFDNEKHKKRRNRWHPLASSEALDLLHGAMCQVTYRRIAMAIKMASKVGVCVDCCLFACCPLIGQLYCIVQTVLLACQAKAKR